MLRLTRSGTSIGVSLLLTVACLVPAALAGAPTLPAGAAPAASGGSTFEAASAAEQAAITAVTTARARREAVEARVRDLDGQLGELTRRADAAAADVARLDAARRNVEAQVVRAKQRVAQMRARAAKAAADLYRRTGTSAPPMLEAFGDKRSLRDQTLRRVYLEHVGERTTDELDGLRAAREDALDAARALRERRAALARAADVARREEIRVGAARAQQTQLLSAARAEEAREQAALAAAESKRVQFERAAAANDAASGSIQGILRSRPGTGHPNATLLFPADGPISSPFGRRVHPIFHDVRMHTGIDIGAGYGAPVHAAAAGTVVVAGPVSGYGNAIVVDHGNGLATLYGHLSRIGVRVGTRVDRGQTIGAVGNTGNSTGPHLHFEVRLHGTPVDPMGYL
jgi:murein DD-endopeptidase MepM/ murein hydrolase activator NlpD